jgi:hypothetical protein
MPARTSTAARAFLGGALWRETWVEYCLDETIPFIKPPFEFLPPVWLHESVAQVKWNVALVVAGQTPVRPFLFIPRKGGKNLEPADA